MMARGSVLVAMSLSPRAAVVEEIEADARAHGGDDTLERIRAATARMGTRDADQDDARAALATLEGLVEIDLDVPTGSRRRSTGLLKGAIKRLIGWYLRYVGHQVTLVGQAVVRLGTVLTDRTETLERKVAGDRRDVEDLAARVARLERQAGLSEDPSAPS
jgi:hypothetical protein